MRWLEHLLILKQSFTPLVIVTVLEVRGHAPRLPGAKMLVTLDESFDTVGGGNLEAMAIELARALLRRQANLPERLMVRLTHQDSLFGVQCCGGEVELLLEPIDLTRPTVAIFGVGHVGLALAQVLGVLPIELCLFDSRSAMLEPDRLRVLDFGQARWRTQAALTEGLDLLPRGSHVLVMTHDHAEDLRLLKAVLARPDLGFVGLIGSPVKWLRFQAKLLEVGFVQPDLDRVTCPIGLPGVKGKTPEAIAIAVAAQLVEHLERLRPARPGKLGQLSEEMIHDQH